ncbi:MAG: serine/threonine-protein phosphatase [Planctomycetes bacterium]|nr:serine/threonine-protein phosphatase [Planctomycetota bacterium]
MAIHQGSTELLAAIPRAFDGVAVRVLDANGAPAASFGQAGAGGTELRAAMPEGALVAAVPAGAEGAVELVQALLAAVVERERLESDMDSMNTSSLRLLEMVSMYGETLPRLSAGGDDAEIANLGVRACQVAAEVKHVVYFAHVPAKACCEVVVHTSIDSEVVRARAQELDAVQVIEGMLADVLDSEGVVLRTVPAGRRLGSPGSVEHLAEREILGVPVSYGAGDKRVLLGAMFLIDKATSYGVENQLDNEEGQLAESFAAMLGSVLGARKTAELGKELSMAHTIQHQVLPARPVQLAGFDIAARYFACGAVGGDYFDYVPLADGRTLVVIADVSGHNLASGMVMVGARAMLRTLASVHGRAEQVFAALASRMYDDLTRTERFLTAAAVAVAEGERGVDYVSAGHNDLFIYRARDDRVEAVASDSTILGFLPAPEYEARRLELEPGDVLLLYTDGITEAVDETGEMFGEERLAALMAQLAPGASARQLVDGIVQALDGFRRGSVGSDDVTMVAIRCTDGGGA